MVILRNKVYWVPTFSRNTGFVWVGSIEIGCVFISSFSDLIRHWAGAGATSRLWRCNTLWHNMRLHKHSNAPLFHGKLTRQFAVWQIRWSVSGTSHCLRLRQVMWQTHCHKWPHSPSMTGGHWKNHPISRSLPSFDQVRKPQLGMV